MTKNCFKNSQNDTNMFTELNVLPLFYSVSLMVSKD